MKTYLLRIAAWLSQGLHCIFLFGHHDMTISASSVLRSRSACAASRSRRDQLGVPDRVRPARAHAWPGRTTRTDGVGVGCAARPSISDAAKSGAGPAAPTTPSPQRPPQSPRTLHSSRLSMSLLLWPGCTLSLYYNYDFL